MFIEAGDRLYSLGEAYLRDAPLPPEDLDQGIILPPGKKNR